MRGGATAEHVYIRCLGPIEIEHDGQLWRPTGKIARFVALLVAHRRGAVRIDQLIDELWAGEPIRKPDAAIRVYLSEVRKRVGFVGITSVDQLIRLSPTIILDVDDFVGCCAQASKSEDPTTHVRLLTSALALWRGEPYNGIDIAPGVIDSTVLEEQRAAAEEHLAAAHLAVGDRVAAIVLLRRLVGELPDREARTLLLMRALCEDGRLAEALRTADSNRTYLRETSGLFPSADANALEQALIARQAAPDPRHGNETSHVPAEMVLSLLKSGEDDWVSAMVARESAFDAAIAAGDLELVAKIALHAEGSGRSFYGEERIAAMLRRAINALSPDGDSVLLTRMHAEYVCRVGLELGIADETVAASGRWLADHSGHSTDTTVDIAVRRAALHLFATTSAGLVGADNQIASFLLLTDSNHHLDAHADALAFAARRALASANGSAWSETLDQIAHFGAVAGRPIDRWARHSIAATRADLVGDSMTWKAHMEAAEAVSAVHDIADAGLAAGAANFALVWQDRLDGTQTVANAGAHEEVVSAGDEGFALLAETLARSFDGAVPESDPMLVALVEYATSMTNAMLRGPILSICAQIVWNAKSHELARSLLSAYESDDSMMVVVGLSPIACFGPTGRYRALMASLCGDERAGSFLDTAEIACESLGAFRWRARLLHDRAAILVLQAGGELDGNMVARAKVAQRFSSRRGAHRTHPSPATKAPRESSRSAPH